MMLMHEMEQVVRQQAVVKIGGMERFTVVSLVYGKNMVVLGKLQSKGLPVV